MKQTGKTFTNVVLFVVLGMIAGRLGLHRSRGFWTTKSALASRHYLLIDLGTAVKDRPRAWNIPTSFHIHSGARNRFGQIVGWVYCKADAGTHAALLQNGVTRDLGTLGGKRSYANALNDKGQVVGYSSLRNGSQHAFFWQQDCLSDLGTLGGTNSTANAINNLGQVVGDADTDLGSTRAFLYSQGVMRDLGTLGGIESCARSINNRGQIVGEAETASGERHAFVYGDGAMLDLNRLTDLPPGWVLTSAERVDDAGCIWGEGLFRNLSYSIVLKPAA